MKNKYSILVICIISIVLFQHRHHYSKTNEAQKLNVTTWDAFGYYAYLPAMLIYDDTKELNWLPGIDSTYQVTGGKLYQANKFENGNYVFKYLGGISILETPLFLIGHYIAKNTDYKADGFSAPYQYSLAYGVLIYFILSLFLLRKILLRYFEDIIVSLSLMLLVLASNLIQYVVIDNAQSHAYIFPLYILVLYFTIKWHENPKIKWASLIGLTIGIAVICRPTEIIMLFIPLLWNTQTKIISKNKWELVRKNKRHIFYIILFGVIGISPQLIYWKSVTGSFVYDVGSKWVFLSPYFRGLFGWERGWFIYTPIAVFFVLGLLYVKKFPFKNSIIVFCILNIWIVISWFDWKYGATYSSRALTQSYGVFAFPLAAIIQRFYTKKGKYLIYLVSVYLISVNLFQIKQYNDTILHYDDMNRLYYAGIYLNSNPSPLVMSLLDVKNNIDNKDIYTEEEIILSNVRKRILVTQSNPKVIFEKQFKNIGENKIKWINIKCKLKASVGFGSSYLTGTIIGNKGESKTEIRIFSPISKAGNFNAYEFYCKVPNSISSEFTFQFSVTTLNNLKGEVESYSILTYKNRELSLLD